MSTPTLRLLPLIAVLLSACSLSAGSASPSSPSASPVSPSLLKATPDLSAQALAQALNTYRKAQGLAEIPISPKLTLTAQTHATDLLMHQPQLQPGPDGAACNLHSWSASGGWTPMCYTDDHAQADKMWSKPREVAGYSGKGFEIAAEGAACADVACLLKIWQDSPAHNQVIVNQGTWASNTWRALGVGIAGRYVTAWFGQEADP